MSIPTSVMENVIPKEAYLDQAYHSQEMANLRDAWHYAALRRDLENDRDWILAQLADREVVVQNFDGTLSAFTNTCSHRFSAIRDGKCGNGALICPYHRWSFDKNGFPAGINFRNTFETRDLNSLRLEVWDVDTCGEFVFVRLHAPGNTTALKDWLGALADRLEAISTVMGEQYGQFDLAVQANWKLVVQNTVEFDHVYSVHRGTFGPLMPPKPKLYKMEIPEPHVGYRSELIAESSPRLIQKRLMSLFENSGVGSASEHEHICLYPFTAIGVFRKESISILRYTATSAGLTQIDTRLFLPRLDELNNTDAALLRAHIPGMVEFAIKLGNEDRQICESVHRGLSNRTRHRGTFGTGERLVWAFQKAHVGYLSGIGASPPSPPAAKHS